MHRLCAALVAVLLAFAWHGPAQASGDYGCAPSWRLGHSELTGCDNMANLQPGNDTRVNLALLLLDLRPSKGAVNPAANADPLFDWSSFVDTLYADSKKPDDGSYADGEGSRCRSNATGSESFEIAVKAGGKLSAAERSALLAARRDLKPSCTGASDGAQTIAALDGQMKSAPAKAFAAYLRGALAFYDADYATAEAQFATLRSTDQPWLKETARYMLGRVEVNSLQLDAFDEYGSLKENRSIDEKTLTTAETALRGYLHDYPKGAYAASARGLLRRVYWLGNKPEKLAAEYAALFVEPPAQRGISDIDLIQEIDNKLLVDLNPTAKVDPILLAVLDLQAMRRSDATDAKPMPLTQIEAQRAALASNQPLYDFLRAAHAYYVANKPADVVRLIPDAARQQKLSYLQFSRQMLRGIALEAMGDRNARGFWVELLAGARQPYQRQAIELALAMHDERGNALARVFEANSPVRTPMIRAILLANSAGPPLLRQQAKDNGASKHERELALYVLLYKGVSRGAYREFLADLAMVPANAPSEGDNWNLLSSDKVNLAVFTQPAAKADFACPSLRDIATQLARDPADPHARLCLGEFMRANSFDQFPLDSQPPKTDLGGAPSLFPGAPYSRLEVYKSIIADPRTPPADKAYALYRAVRCYAPSGNNSCSGKEVPKSQRKAWFDRLHKDYPRSIWATNLQVYW